MSTATAPSSRVNWQRVGSSVLPTTRHPARLLAGALTMIVFALIAVAIYGQVGNKTEVLALVRDVEQGHVITDSDVRVVEVSTGAEVTTVPVSQRSLIVGRVATTHLFSGGLLTTSSATEAKPVPSDKATVGSALKKGQYPAGLKEGDPVWLVIPGTADVSGALPIAGTVASLEQPSETSEIASASFVVAKDSAAAVGVAGASGNLVVVMLPQ